MLIVRGVLNVLVIGVGAVLVVRMLGTGLHFTILPGLVLGIAMVALGMHRFSLIRRAQGAAR